MENYFQVIDGIKYDTGQAISLAEGKFTYDHDLKDKNFNFKLLLGYNFQTITLKYYLFKGVNNHYFIHIIRYDENKLKKRKNISIVEENHIGNQYIKPITKDEAINCYFNYYKERTIIYNDVKLNKLVSEQEAFGEIAIA